MTVTAEEFSTHIVEPTLRAMRMRDERARRLLVLTGSLESDFNALVQIGGGPAVSPFQIEWATFDDIFDRYLRRRADLMARVRQTMTPMAPRVQLPGNPLFACAIARIKYWMDEADLPHADDADAMGAYYKRVFNTAGGKGDAKKAAARYRQLFDLPASAPATTLIDIQE